MLFHSGTYPHSNPLAIAAAARHFPQVPFVLGHFGLADLSWECFAAADLSANVHVDTTSNPMVRVLGEWVDRFGAERMLWGSDFPFYNVEYERLKVDYISASTRNRELISSENAARLYRIG
jgi:predicted TIM-barrel fold metal-dependent hydrolase